MSLSIAIMGHPSRAAFIEYLQERLPSAEVVLDKREDRWETGRRAQLAFDPKATHHLCIQDDALPCRNSFLPACERIIEAVPENPISLYIGCIRPEQDVVVPALRRARRTGSPWIVMDGPKWGVAVITPTAHIERMVKWGDAHSGIPAYDRRMGHYWQARNIPCYYTVPSIVDHRSVKENPSIVDPKHRTGDRQAHEFIGRRSPLKIDWTREPVKAPAQVLFRNPRTGSRFKVLEGSRRYRILLQRADLELIGDV